MLYERIHFINSDWVSMNETHEYDSDPDPIAEHKGKWVRRIDNPAPVYDELRQTVRRVKTVTEFNVTTSHPVTDKTVDEVESEKREQVSNLLDDKLGALAASTRHRSNDPLFTEQAQLFKRKPGAPVRALRRRAQRSGITVDAMADKIIAKANVYEDGLADITGDEDVLSAAIDTAVAHPTMTDEQKIDAIILVEWP